MGCMYDGRPINGAQGGPGINAGEKMTLPYHIGHQLAKNLAKVMLVRTAPATDPAGIPTGVPLWDTVRLENMKDSFLTDLYVEDKPTAMSQTDMLMAKVEEYKKMVDQLIATKSSDTVIEPVVSVEKAEMKGTTVYQDKVDVITELEKRRIVHDKRKSKAELEKLLA